MDVYKQNSILQGENNDLKIRVAELENKLTSLTDLKDNEKTEISSFLQETQTVADLQNKLRESQYEESRLRAILEAQESSLMNSISMDDPLHSQLVELKKQVTVDISKRASEQQQVVSNTLLENAKLKREIAMTEASNAELTIEIQELRSRLGDIDGDDLEKGAESTRLREMLNDYKQKYETEHMRYEASTKTIARLKEQIKKLEESNQTSSETLSSQLKTFEKENENLRSDNQNYIIKIKTIENQLQEANKKILLYEKKIETAEENHKSFIQESATNDTKLQNAKSEIQRLQTELREVKEINNRLKHEHESKIASSEQSIAKLQDRVREMQSKESELQKSMTETIQNHTEVKAKTQAEVSELRLQNEKLKRDNQQLSSDLSNANNERSELEEKLRSANTRINSMEQKIAALESAAKEKTARASEVEDKLKRSIVEQDDTTRLLTRLRLDKEDLTAKNIELTQRLNAEVLKTSELKDQQRSFAGEVEVYQKQIQELHDSNEKLQKVIIEMRAKGNALSNQLMEVTSQREIEGQQAALFKETIGRLRSELSTVKESTARAKQAELSIQRKDSQIRSLTQELDSIKAELKESQNKIIELNSKVNKYKFAAQSAQEQLSGVQHKLELQEIQRKGTHPMPSEMTVQEIASATMRRAEAVNERYLRRLDILGARVDTLRASLDRASSFVHEKRMERLSDSDRMRFLRQIEAHLRVIDSIAGRAAKLAKVGTPPRATELLNDPAALEKFLSALRKPKRHHCHHTDEDVNRVLNLDYHL